MAITKVNEWYQAGQFTTAGRAQGAFELAHLQGLDIGLDGVELAKYMGLSLPQFTSWLHDGTLPRMRGSGADNR